MNNIQKKTICELFAGVGGFRLGFERLNSGWETVWFSQWEPGKKAQWAHDCYVKHFGDCEDLNGEIHTNDDISIVDKNNIPDHTLLVGGFPCQDYSVAQSLSTSKGIEGKKGVLWWQILDTIEAKNPNFCMFENVDRLISSPAKQRGRDFGIILACLNNLNYSVEWRVINAADYGAAQKRRRTFIFAYKNNTGYGEKIRHEVPSEIIESKGFMAKSFPIDKCEGWSQCWISDDIEDISNNFTFNFKNAGYMNDGDIYTTKVYETKEKPIPLSDILEKNVNGNYYLSDKQIEKFKYLKGSKRIPRVSKDGHEYVFSEGSIPFPDKLSEPGRTMLTSESSTNRSTHIVKDPETGKLRLLTPTETERLQGFDDGWTKTGMPNNSRYYCMGNALVVPMVTRMGKTLDNILDMPKKKPFLLDHQIEAVANLSNGKILNGGVGSGKSRTGLYYYFNKNGGYIDEDTYQPMTNKQDLVIITTAATRDKLGWDKELTYFLLSKESKKNGLNLEVNITIDSWNNIKKYENLKDCFFIFDEDHLTGNGVWVRTFYKIARHNDWIILSATPGDKWEDYIPVFLANGFYKNRTEFNNEHLIYARFSKYPKVTGYRNTGRLNRLKREILVDMDFKRNTISHDEDIYVKYDISKYKETTRTRWDCYKNEPIQQASGLCYVLRRIVNESEYRSTALLELLEKVPKAIIFYNFDYELDILMNLEYGEGVKKAQWNGHSHEPIPDSDRWVYFVQYNACEGWNCIKTDTIIFFSQNYSYKNLVQAKGRIDRMNTPFKDLYYYHIKSRSGIDLAISKALRDKKTFNEKRWTSRSYK